MNRQLTGPVLFLAFGLSACAITFPPPGGGPVSKPPQSAPPPSNGAQVSLPNQTPASAPAQPAQSNPGQTATLGNPAGNGASGNHVVVHDDLGHGGVAVSSGAALSEGAAAALAARPTPDAALLPLEWFQGDWVSTNVGKGGVAQYRIESYGPIVGAVITGSYVEVENGQPKLYELIAIESTPQGVDLCLRHFSAGLVPWKSEALGPQRYRLVRASASEAVFERQPSAPGQPVNPDHARLLYQRQGERLNVRVENLDQTGGLDFAFQRVP